MLDWQESEYAEDYDVKGDEFVSPDPCNAEGFDDYDDIPIIMGTVTKVRLTCWIARSVRGYYRVLQIPVLDVGFSMQTAMMEAGLGEWRTYFISSQVLSGDSTLPKTIKSWTSDTVEEAKRCAEEYDAS